MMLVLPRLVVISGVSSGTGLATARRFAVAGDHVVNLDRSAPAPGDAVGQWVAADVRDWAALDDAIGRVIAEHGPSRWRSRTPGSARVARSWT